jgi:catechol 2,3-dioxygenase-like lactoylglutathione lyase family enzyme
MPVHINLTVADVNRSTRFYRQWLGFLPGERTYADGTVFIRDEEGTDLAFHSGLSSPPPRTFHFGFRRGSPETVRQLYARTRREQIEVTEFEDEPDIVSVKFLDPDGYEIEVYWEPSP